MLKHFFLFVCSILSTLCANELINSVSLFPLEDAKHSSFHELRKTDGFKPLTLPFYKESAESFFVKINLNKEVLKNKSYVLSFYAETAALVFDTSNPKLVFLNERTLLINQHNFSPELYVKLINYQEELFFDVEAIEHNELLEDIETMELFFGVAYGVILTAFLYYLALFIYNRKKSYIYYACTQLSMLALLLFTAYLEVKDESGVIISTILLCFFTFSNLFTKHFLNTKTLTPRMHQFLNILLALYVLDFILDIVLQIGSFSEFFPLMLFLVSYLVIALYIYIKKGQKHALFYFLGWSMMLCSYLFVELHGFFPELSLEDEAMLLMHITTPIESLILAFALSYKMKMLELEKEEQKDFLIYQSKMAAMGEMLANIAHQWRQPLTHLSYIFMNIQTAFRFNKLSQEFFEQNISDGNKQLDYMSNTIHDFQNFYKISKQKEQFLVVDAVEEVLALLRPILEKHNISVHFSYEQNINMFSYRGEFLQVLLNLVNNAKDALLLNNIEDAHINIYLEERNESVCVLVQDNAGGICEEILEKIFEPYFTTKDKGLGLGLYMSKMIVEKNMQGHILAKNKAGGALFSLHFKK